MRTRRIIRLAIVASIAGAVLSMAGAVYLSWVLAVQGERNELQQVAQRVLERTRLVVDQATEVLREMNLTPLTPCTPVAHRR